jgi:hypothetical protein
LENIFTESDAETLLYSGAWGPPFLKSKANKPEWEKLRDESAYFQAVNRFVNDSLSCA